MRGRTGIQTGYFENVILNNFYIISKNSRHIPRRNLLSLV